MLAPIRDLDHRRSMSVRRNEFLGLLVDQLGSDLRGLPQALRDRSTPEGRLRRSGSIDELREAMRRSVPPTLFDFVEGAAGDEITCNRNRERFRDWTLEPRVLQKVQDIDLATSVLGRRVEVPLLGAPVGGCSLYNNGGEAAVARAVHAAGSIYVLSGMASQTIERVAEQAPGPNWFQAYLWKDHGLLLELLARARAAGYEALVLTVDTPRVGQRERDRRNGFTVPPRVTLRSILGGLTRPRWSAQFVRAPSIRIANVQGDGDTEPIDLSRYQFDQEVTWDDLAFIRDGWNGPFVLKGILTAADAARAAAHGIDAVIVSNHGGRQLDHAPASIDALPRVREAAGEMEVLFDGGVRRGSDIVKALSLGARACLIGRPLIYGLGVAGEAGAAHALRLLTNELTLTLTLLGCPSVGQLDASWVAATHDHEKPSNGPDRARSITPTQQKAS
jgi:isopentenyl diphosphate isomerase/L-lactate dehydrogenase-like FMN-dependent dehydrogenase